MFRKIKEGIMDTKKLGTFVLCVLIGITCFVGFNKFFNKPIQQENTITENVVEKIL